MNKIAKTILWGLLAAAWLSGANAWAQADPLEQGAMSVRKLDDGLYYMEYKGDDGFASLLENGGGRSAAELSAYVTRFLSKGFYPPKSGNPGPMDYGCSALTVRTLEGGVLMAGDKAQTNQESGKPALTTTSAICYLLKNAATVDEALDLLRSIDMHSDIGAAHHYAISDATGRSVVVEYVDNRMEVVESAAVANHYLCEAKLNVGLIKGDRRYEVLCSLYDATGGTMDKLQLTKTIASVSLSPTEGGHMGTAWTMVMDLTTPSVTYYSRRHFDKPFHFEFERKELVK